MDDWKDLQYRCNLLKDRVRKETEDARLWPERHSWYLDLLSERRKRAPRPPTPPLNDCRDIRPLANSTAHEHGWLGSRREFIVDPPVRHYTSLPACCPPCHYCWPDFSHVEAPCYGLPTGISCMKRGPKKKRRDVRPYIGPPCHLVCS